MPTVYKEVEIDVDLDDFSDEELVCELKSRNSSVVFDNVMPERLRELMETIWYQRRTGQDYTRELDQLIWLSLGRTV